MNWLKCYDNISYGIRSVVLYYILYNIIFALTHLILLSIFSFFHFLLDHDMNTIENWLNRNTWEILSVSKLAASLCIYKFVRLNRYVDTRIKDLINNESFFPSDKIIGFSLYLLVFVYAFIVQFGGGVSTGQFKEELFYSSFIGSFLFYFIDILVLYFFITSFELKKKDYTKVLYSSLFVFILTTKITLPYLNKFYVFLIIHFISLFYLAKLKRGMDCFYYSLFVIAPLSSLYGLDIVWDNAYSLFSYQSEPPSYGLLLIWGLGLGYFHLSRLD